ncbi:MAG TPA: AAA family ATPase [Flavobacteriaceae bacterium]|nr:AAA family ATPase [Flavobacteriaceae bacterium]
MIDNFEKWLIDKDHKKENTAYSYKLAVPKLSEHYSSHIGEDVDLFDLATNALRDIIPLYTQDGQHAEYGAKGNGTYRSALNALLRMKKDNEQTLIEIEELINEAIRSPYIEELINAEEFYFQHLLNVKDAFFDYSISESEIERIIEDYEAYKDGTFEDYVIQSDESVRPFLELLAEYISYLDEKASGKDRWNKYRDKRTIALAFVRMPYWVKNLLRFKVNSEFTLPGSINNAVRYSIDPTNNLTVLSENHRKILSNTLLNKEYNKITFQEDIYEFFGSFNITANNEMNYGYIISSILYSPEVKAYWDSNEVQEVEEEDLDYDSTTVNEEVNRYNSKPALNQIFFGPPGTGKTYRTINEALKIVDNDFYNQHKDNREKLTERYRELLITDWDKTDGQIAFTTFHQSFSYEDFVEGIKPRTEDKKVFYETQRGIFKRICDLADSSQSSSRLRDQGRIAFTDDEFRNAFFYKLSLGDDNNPEDRWVYKHCINNNCIAIGFGGDFDYSGKSETEIESKCKELDENESAGRRLNTFIHGLSINDYVLISHGNQYVRALGRITGEYEYKENTPIDYKHFREVEWIFVDENIPFQDIYSTEFSPTIIYKLDHDLIKEDFFVPKATILHKEEKEIKPYVLIVDEINRGNVSSIFGELITLLEKDKRIGEAEALEVMLPYSKDKFGVPNNVYIIGTMNTADRSVEALDTALRRRFSFTEIPPCTNVILEHGKANNGIAEGIDLIELLNTINTRIEKLIDKDHKIGHSYFLNVTDLESLKKCFKNKIIPLLEEYFFGDYGKIGLVLGNSFVEVQEDDNKVFSDFDGYESDVIADLEERKVYKIKTSDKWDFKTI